MTKETYELQHLNWGFPNETKYAYTGSFAMINYYTSLILQKLRLFQTLRVSYIRDHLPYVQQISLRTWTRANDTSLLAEKSQYRQ